MTRSRKFDSRPVIWLAPALVGALACGNPPGAVQDASPPDAAETSYDIDHSNRTYGLHPLDRLAQFGLVNESLLAVHMTQLDEGNIKTLAQQGVNVVHCPQSNMKLASGICPVRDLMDAGVNVCIGTDGAASNNNLDLLEEVRSAALLAKVATADATALNAITAVEMMTINGATALGIESEIGSIEVGKKADLCAIDLDCAATQPLHNLFSQITYAASSSQISDVWIDGRRVMAESKLNTLDEQEILATAKAWRARLEAPSQSEEVAV